MKSKLPGFENVFLRKRSMFIINAKVYVSLACSFLISIGFLCLLGCPGPYSGPDPVDLPACDKLSYIGDFKISAPSDISTLAGHNAISGDLQINCSQCIDLKFLHCLKLVGGDLDVSDNDSLTNLEGLNQIASVGGDLTVSNNDFLPDLYGLRSLTSVDGSVWIDGNASLVGWNGMSALGIVGGDFRITNNDSLTRLHGLFYQSSVAAELWVHDNDNLPDCEVCDLLDKLSHISTPGTIVVHDNFDDECTPVPTNCPGYDAGVDSGP